jgi:serine O-acetyltransferase
MMRSGSHPINQWISNSLLTDIFLNCLRRSWRLPAKLLGLIFNTEIACPLPKKLFLPHPYGIIVGSASRIGESVTLMQQVTLGGKDPWCKETDLRGLNPILEEGVYVGAGAKILGAVTIGAWSIVGANAVVTKSVPPFSTVLGINRIVASGSRPPGFLGEEA